jgi:hypothetical protein
MGFPITRAKRRYRSVGVVFLPVHPPRSLGDALFADVTNSEWSAISEAIHFDVAQLAQSCFARHRRWEGHFPY